MNIKKFAAVASATIFALMALVLFNSGAPDDQVLPPPANDAVNGGPDFDKSAVSPKIQYALHRVGELYRTQGMEAVQAYAAGMGIDLDGESVRVVAVASTPMGTAVGSMAAVTALSAQLGTLGGVVETTADNLIQSRVPISSLDILAEHPLVDYVRLPLKPQTTVVTSEGVEAVGAAQFQGLGAYRTNGREVNVAVMDAGFTGYSSLTGTELPGSVITKSFRSDGKLSVSEHGTACAEVIHDIAPNANLTLVNFGTDVEHRNAVNWINSQSPKPEIISNSMAWFNAGDGKGTGPICQDVNNYTDDGSVWTVAAGNYANNHWEGTFSDPDNDTYMEFDGSGYEWLYVYLPAYYAPAFYINWDDWGNWNGSAYTPATNQDYDISLYWSTGGAWNYIESSATWQNGVAGQWPVEAVGGWYANVPAYWGIRIHKYSTTRNCKLEAVITGIPSGLKPSQWVGNGSISIPGDSPNAVTVGAVDWSNQARDPNHSYSSMGPTHNGTIKPDFSSPSRVSTQTYGPTDFSGTSAATPHMAGILALFREKTPYSLAQIVNILTGRAIDLGSAGKDNTYGVGFSTMQKK